MGYYLFLTLDSIGMNNAVRILILEDDARDAVLIKDELQRSGLEFRSKRVETRNDFISSLELTAPT